ncbi:MAG: tetratricopeptide repeat protein [Deltaproteobacteria bacterium]|nr:tetratricopeptide repeat protein [Deltaproteobacteria bacterium]
MKIRPLSLILGLLVPAMLLFSSACSVESIRISSMHVRAYTALESGKYGVAIDHYRNILALDPDDRDALIAVGRCLIHVNDADGAVQALLHAREIDPRKDSAAAYLGLAFLLNDQKARAIDEWEDFIAGNPGSSLTPVLRERVEHLTSGQTTDASPAGGDLHAAASLIDEIEGALARDRAAAEKEAAGGGGGCG